MSTNVEMYDEAIALQGEGKVEEAIGKLQDLLKDDPDYALAHAALSKFYSLLDNHDKAVEHAKKVCELEPEDSFSFVAMSMICQKADRMEEAEQAMAQARDASAAQPSE